MDKNSGNPNGVSDKFVTSLPIFVFQSFLCSYLMYLYMFLFLRMDVIVHVGANCLKDSQEMVRNYWELTCNFFLARPNV